MSIKDDELGMEGLTPEERAALAEPDTEDHHATQEDLEAAAAAATTTDANANEAKNAPETGNGANDAAAAHVPAAAAAPLAADNAADAGAAEPGPTQSKPIFVAEVPADAEARLAEIATKKADLLTKFDDGDLTAREFQTQVDVLTKDERSIERAIDKAEIARDMENQRQTNQWNDDCTAFLSKPEHALYADPATFAEMNETLIAFAKMPRNANLNGPQLLDRAHRAFMAERGTPVAVVAATAPAATAAPKAPPRPALPPSLGAMPSASANDPGEGRFAGLDRLQDTDPAAYEAAVSKLSSADHDAYLMA